MLRWLKLAFLAALGLALLTVALANRGTVTLRLLPEGIGGFVDFGGSVELPLFLVIFGGIVAGLLIGFVWEWLREAKLRNQSSQRGRQVAKLEREVSRLREAQPEKGDEVLALLEDTRPAR